eukprot:gene15459-12869_t
MVRTGGGGRNAKLECGCYGKCLGGGTLLACGCWCPCLGACEPGPAAAPRRRAALGGEEGAWAPGEYVAVERAQVGETIERDSAKIAVLPRGRRVRVIEVVRRDDLRRIRGRIDDPAGWVSLEDLGDRVGYRWVAPAARVDGSAPVPVAAAAPGAGRLTGRRNGGVAAAAAAAPAPPADKPPA